MNQSLKKNYIYNLIYQIILIILPIITIPYLSRVLGANNIGIYSYTLSISAYFVLFGSLGISLYGKREIAYVQNDKKKYSKIFWELFLLKIISVLISLLAFYILFVYRNNPYNTFYKILVIELIANAIDISWFFQGLEDFKKIVIRNLVIKLLSLICIFTFVKSSKDLYIYYYIYVGATFLCNLSLWLYLPKYLAKIDFKKINIFKHLKGTLILFVPEIAIQVYTVLDRTMIGYIINDKSEVGFYTQGERIIKLLLTVITAMGIVMLPRIANKFSIGDKKSIDKYIYKSFNLVYFLSFPMIFGIISVSNSFVPLFFGNGYDKVVPIMQIISPIVLFIGMSNVIGVQYLLPTKQQKEYTFSVVFGAIVNFVFNYIFIRKIGAIGAAIGTVIAEFIVATTQIFFVRKELEIKKILKSFVQYFICSIIMFIFCMIIAYFVTSNLLSIIIQVIVGILVYFSCLLFIKNDFLLEIIKVVKNNFKRGEKKV